MKTSTRVIFLVGMPRSGTTVIFETLAARHDLAWFSNHLQRFPGVPALSALSRLVDLTPMARRSVGRSDQARRWLRGVQIGPHEAYRIWERCCGEKFLFDYLLGVQATSAERECVRTTVANVLRYHGKPHFAAKLTGPGRLGYLWSIFPDARVVHVVRDGRAVVQSLMRIRFWRQRNRMNTPAWQNGLTEQDLADWERFERSPLALAAVQWRRVVETIRDEAARQGPNGYAEINYERFVAEPEAVLRGITEFYGLPHSIRAEALLRARLELRDMNQQWRERFDGREISMLNELLRDTLETFSYEIDPPTPPDSGPVIVTPF